MGGGGRFVALWGVGARGHLVMGDFVVCSDGLMRGGRGVGLRRGGVLWGVGLTGIRAPQRKWGLGVLGSVRLWGAMGGGGETGLWGIREVGGGRGMWGYGGCGVMGDVGTLWDGSGGNGGGGAIGKMGGGGRGSPTKQRPNPPGSTQPQTAARTP